MYSTQDLPYFTYGKDDSRSMITYNRKTLKITYNSMNKFKSMVFK